MNDSTLDPGILVFVDRQTKAETAVIAILAEDEFKRAQTIFPELSAYRGFEEWRESREGLQMGLAMAGVAAKMVPVFLAPFLAWRRLTRTAPTERALDAFASTILPFRSAPEPVVLAVVSEQQFAAYSRNVAALSPYRDYRQWLRHRRALRARAATSGLPIEELPILIGDFVDWSACLGQSYASSIDRYAHLMLEHFADDLDK
jgi:hypothetical protein